MLRAAHRPGRVALAAGRVLIGVSLVEDLAWSCSSRCCRRSRDRAAPDGPSSPDSGSPPSSSSRRCARARVMPWLLVRVARTRSEELFLLVTRALGWGRRADAGGRLSLALGAFPPVPHQQLRLRARDRSPRLLRCATRSSRCSSSRSGPDGPAAVVANLPLLGVMLLLIIPGKFVNPRGHRVALRLSALHRPALSASAGPDRRVLVRCSSRFARTAATSATTSTTRRWPRAPVDPRQRQARSATRGRGSTACRPRRPRFPRKPAPAIGRRHVIHLRIRPRRSAVGEALDTFDIPYRVIERDPDVVRALRQRGVPPLFGDSAHRDLLVRPASPTRRSRDRRARTAERPARRPRQPRVAPGCADSPAPIRAARSRAAA